MCTHSVGWVGASSQQLFAPPSMPPYSILPNLHHPLGGSFTGEEIEVQIGEVMGRTPSSLQCQNLNVCSGRCALAQCFLDTAGRAAAHRGPDPGESPLGRQSQADSAALWTLSSIPASVIRAFL